MAGWPAAEQALLLRLVQDGKTPFECWQEFQDAEINRTQRAVERHIQEERKKSPGRWRAQVKPSAVAPILSKHISWTSNRTLCIFDPHCPFHDHAFLNRLITLAIGLSIDTVVIGGDLIDYSALNSFERIKGVETEDEIDATRHLIKILARNFETVIYIVGNHDLRMAKKLGWMLSVEEDIKKFVEAGVENVSGSDYRWMELKNGGETYRVVHPKNSSINAPLVPRKLASKYHCNIIAGHGHTIGYTRDDSNWYWAIDSGVVNDPRKISYVTKEMSTRPQVMQGATIIIDGIPVLLTPQNLPLYEE